MSKIFEVILKAVLVILFFCVIVFLGSIMRSHILLPIITLLLSLLLAFLFYKVPDFWGNGSLNSVLKYAFYFSIVASFVCFVYASRSEAYIEKYFFGGKVRQAEVEVEGPDGEDGSSTYYYLEGINSVNDRIVHYSYWILVLGVPYLIWRMWNRVPGPK